MHITTLLSVALSTSLLSTNVLALPDRLSVEASQSRSLEIETQDYSFAQLDKRRGGGGGRSGGSTSGGTSGGTTGGTTGGTSGGTRSGGSSSGSGGRYGPSYGGRYPGGGTSSFPAGRAIGVGAPVLLLGGGLAFWAVASGYGWGPYGVYTYRYPTNITFYNSTTMMNESLPGVCLCSRYQGCSCSADTPGNETVTALVGDGTYSYAQDNEDLFQVQDVNGTRTLAINGTVDNSTDGTTGNYAGPGKQGLVEKASLFGLVAVLASGVYLI